MSDQSEAAGPVGPAEPGDVGPFYRRNTPSVGGYVVAALCALGIGSVLVPVAFGGASSAADLLPGIGLVLAFGFFVVLVIGAPLTVIAHFAVRTVERQSVHVAAFGVVGLLTGSLVGLYLFDPVGFPLPVVLAVGVSAAAGRAVVNRRPR